MTQAFADEVGQSAVHPLAKNLADHGALACADRANQIATFLDGKMQSQAIVQPWKDKPNQRLLMSTLVIPTEGDDYAIGGIALAPNQANGCGGSYRVITYSNKTCSQTIGERYPNVKFRQMNQLKVQIAVLNMSMWVIAMPADKGCVMIKEELVD